MSIGQSPNRNRSPFVQQRLNQTCQPAESFWDRPDGRTATPPMYRRSASNGNGNQTTPSPLLVRKRFQTTVPIIETIEESARPKGNTSPIGRLKQINNTIIIHHLFGTSAATLLPPAKPIARQTGSAQQRRCRGNQSRSQSHTQIPIALLIVAACPNLPTHSPSTRRAAPTQIPTSALFLKSTHRSHAIPSLSLYQRLVTNPHRTPPSASNTSAPKSLRAQGHHL